MIKVVLKDLIRTIAYKITKKYINEESLEIISIDEDLKDIKFFNLSSNPIISFYYRDKLYFFRECPLITNRKLYFKSAIEQFFDSLQMLDDDKRNFKQDYPINLDFNEEIVKQFKAHIRKKANHDSFVSKLARFDQIARNDGFSIWTKQPYDVSFFKQYGFDDIPENMYDIALYFIWVMKSAAGNYRTFKIIKGKRHSFFSAVKAVSSKIVADELGLNHMITDAKWCNISIENSQDRFGLLCEAAPGIRMMDSDVLIDSELQKELTNLNVLDLINNEVDHGPNNYNVVYENGKTNKICAFDNDNPKTFFPVFSVKHNTACGTQLISKDGLINRPHMDIELAERIKAIDYNKLKKALTPYLNPLQIYALLLRIKKINNAIQATQSKKTDFLLNACGWNENTVNEELSGVYGETYLSKLRELEKSN